MEEVRRYLLIALAAYLTGSLNGSLLASRLLMRDDIRKHGSGNAGATNVLRTYGVKWTILVSAWDIGKGVLAIWIGHWIWPAQGFLADGGRGYAVLLAGFFVIVGHVFPLFFKFKGGKGVFSACAVMFTLDWQVAAISLSVFFLFLLITRFLSLGSITSVFTLPFLGLLFGRVPAAVAMYAAVCVLIIALHHENIGRLRKGKENKFPRNRNTA